MLILDNSRAITPKFDDDPLKNIQVTEQTRLILDNSRAITPKFDDNPLKKYSSYRADMVYFGNFG